VFTPYDFGIFLLNFQEDLKSYDGVGERSEHMYAKIVKEKNVLKILDAKCSLGQLSSAIRASPGTLYSIVPNKDAERRSRTKTSYCLKNGIF
jgi:hypothetical protein